MIARTLCKLENYFFTDLSNILFFSPSVDDQMKLLQQSWSDMLILDHLHQRLHNGVPEEITMPNGQKFSMVNLALLGVSNMVEQLNIVSARLQELKFDPVDYICLKFLLLLNPGCVSINFICQ
ncbi:UNVERIFIED_CONTAM: Nuclear hormone receptor FTZ-F1 [Trichonephila clavipes]